jgi:hypothetical protein
MKKENWFYIHTIDGIPAQYIDGEQIVFANVVFASGIRGNAGMQNICSSKKQILLEQKLSKKWRKKEGFSIDDLGYSFVRLLKKPSIT